MLTCMTPCLSRVFHQQRSLGQTFRFFQWSIGLAAPCCVKGAVQDCISEQHKTVGEGFCKSLRLEKRGFKAALPEWCRDVLRTGSVYGATRVLETEAGTSYANRNKGRRPESACILKLQPTTPSATPGKETSLNRSKVCPTIASSRFHT